MRALLMLVASLGLVAAAPAADAVTGQVLKVLPFLLDQQGRIATSPSLFDRDAYQAYLRLHTNEVSAVRFDILWQAAKSPDASLKIALELRGIGTNSIPRLQTLETNVIAGSRRQWTEIPLAAENLKNFGTIVAWRARLWNGGELLGEEKSFLW